MKMAKFDRNIAIVATAISAVLLLGTMHYNWDLYQMFQFEQEDCKTNYCNDFNFVCCVEEAIPEVKSSSNDAPCKFLGIGKCMSECTDASNYASCPTYATRCTVDVDVDIYSVCSLQTNRLGCWENQCSGKQVGTRILSPGEWAVVKGVPSTSKFSMKIYKQKLVDCGRAGCTQGLSVLGSVGCTFKTDDSIYDENGRVVKTPTPGQSMEYTVPYGECWLYTTANLRRECGNTCEQCDTHSDCVAGRTYTYEYEGQTYGAEFQSNQLILYGCRKYDSVCLEKDVLPDGTENCLGGYAIDSRCEIVKYLPAGCMPGSDSCGANAFCDPQTLTCKSSGIVECSSDFECGQSVSCDWTTKTIKGKVCQDNKCVTVDKQTVECCYDVNCPTGYECTSSNTCVESAPQKTACPYECCIGDTDWFDKLCIGTDQCLNHVCVSEDECLPEHAVIGEGQMCCDGLEPKGSWVKTCEKKLQIMGTLIALALSALMFFKLGADALKKRDWVSLAIPLIISLMVFAVSLYLIENWQVILGGSIIFTLLGGLAIWFFPGVILFFIMFAKSVFDIFGGKK